MNTATKIILGLFGVGAIIAIIMVMSGIGVYNQAINQERGIVAQYKQDQNNYSSYVNKLAETAQVPAMYMEDLSKLYGQVIKGRQGSDKELFRFIKEANPQVDAGLYRQIQQVIEAGRNSFEADQKTLLDKKRVYEVTLQTFPDNMLLGFMGFPRIKLDDYDIVTDEKTEVAFKTKKQEPIKLREPTPPQPAGK